MSYAAVIPPRRDRHRMQHNADIGLFTEPSIMMDLSRVHQSRIAGG
ncbi:MAG: hypothetical protein JRF34_08820 [Deltaproteobacteria bacterium]|nr:hypothetical protein [Deltaproteobacteria bacterium]